MLSQPASLTPRASFPNTPERKSLQQKGEDSPWRRSQVWWQQPQRSFRPTAEAGRTEKRNTRWPKARIEDLFDSFFYIKEKRLGWYILLHNLFFWNYRKLANLQKKSSQTCLLETGAARAGLKLGQEMGDVAPFTYRMWLCHLDLACVWRRYIVFPYEASNATIEHESLSNIAVEKSDILQIWL